VLLYSAPASIQARSVSICSGVSERLDSGGGIRSSGSSVETRAMSLLVAASPGTTTPRAVAPSK
jgi:hypothetical protein